ncbi:mucin-5AC-like [Haliotis rufescens]|uniref:mucin-5AC-like n=1 Tax=Haliotis rufescens TaxID=6454 RepID=UPI00201F5561|nr:mucin-5AC-like [Haliotis rufescens]
MGQVLFALVILLACSHGQCGFPPTFKGSLFSPPVTNTASVGSIVPVAPLNPAPAPAPTPALVNPFLSVGLASAPAPAPAPSSNPLSGVPSVTGTAPAPAPSGNAPPGGFLNPTKNTKSPYGQISMNHVMNMDFGINMDVSFIKRVENKDDKYCQTHCLNDLQNCAVAVHCDWTPPAATTAAPCVGNIFQCGTFSINRGGTADKGVCLFFEQKTGLEDTDPGITSESNCREVVYHPTCRDWTAGVPDHWVPTGRPTFQTGAAVSHSFLCEEGYQKTGVLKVTCDHTGKKTPQSGASCTLPGESTNTGGGLPSIDIPILLQANTFPAPAPVVTTRKPDITSPTTSSTTSPTTSFTTSSTTSPTTSFTTSSTTTTSPTTSPTTSSTTTTSPTTSPTTSSTTTTSPTTSPTTSSTTTTSPTTSPTTSSTTTTSPTTSPTTSSTTTTSPTTSPTTSSTTTTSPTTSPTTSSTTTSPTTSSTTTSSTTTTSPTTSPTTSSPCASFSRRGHGVLQKVCHDSFFRIVYELSYFCPGCSDFCCKEFKQKNAYV